jgi:hypothetical protein
VERGPRISNPLGADRQCQHHGTKSLRPHSWYPSVMLRLSGWKPRRWELEWESCASEHGRRRGSGEGGRDTRKMGARRRAPGSCRKLQSTSVIGSSTSNGGRGDTHGGGAGGGNLQGVRGRSSAAVGGGSREIASITGRRLASEEGGGSKRCILEGHAQPGEEGWTPPMRSGAGRDG